MIEAARENYVLAIESQKQADKAGIVSDWNISDRLHDYHELLQQLQKKEENKDRYEKNVMKEALKKLSSDIEDVQAIMPSYTQIEQRSRANSNINIDARAAILEMPREESTDSELTMCRSSSIDQSQPSTLLMQKQQAMADDQL